MRKLLPVVVVAILLSSCANIGSLGGGKVDEQAPKIVNSNLSKTNFTNRKIYIEFDEYITLNNPEKNIILQPAHTTMKFSITKKKVVINFDSALKANTTYNLIIDKGITDNNANNPFSYIMTFSTGNSIDSGQIRVKLSDYKDKKTLKIALSLNSGSDSFKNFQTDYILDANKDLIQFNGLNDTKYNLWLFTDDDNDLKPDIYKPINFIKNPQQDTTYELKPVNWPEPFRIKKAFTDSHSLKIKYTTTIPYSQKLERTFTNTQLSQFVYYNTDSALMLLGNDNSYILSRIPVPIDTIPSIDYRKEARNMVKASMRVMKVKNEFQTKLLQPQYYTSPKTFKPMEEIIIATKKLDSFLMFPWNLKTEIPDTFYIKNFQLIDYKSLTYININLKSKKDKTYDLVILKDDKDYLKLYDIKSYENYLQPGLYKIQVFENSLNQIFDPFNLSPAPAKLYEKQVQLKANWEEILSVDLE
jgi:hypothetical protein